MATTQSQLSTNLVALGFDNVSNTAIYNQIAQALGLVVDSTLTEINDAENVIISIISNQRYGKSAYYTSKALAFQYGDDLTTDASTLDEVYATIDTNKQIITQAAFEEIISGSTSSLYLKVATTDVATGDLIALNSAQFDAFSSYFSVFELPGLPISIISVDANVFAFSYLVSYYKTYDLSALKANLANALTAFRKGFAFDGELYAGDLQDYIKTNVPGVRDFYIYNTLIDGVPFNGYINLDSGYFNYDTSGTNEIKYVPV